MTGADGPGRPQLVLACGSLREVSFADRIRAAAAAGFDGIGLTFTEYGRLLDAGATAKSLVATARSAGIAIDEVEAVVGVADPGCRLPGSTPPAVMEQRLELAAALGARRIVTLGGFGAEPGPATAEHFAAWCDRAAAHGITVALEFLPGTDVPDLATAAEILATAARPNAGINLDSWHFTRSGSDLAGLPGAPVAMFQISDGAVAPAAGLDYIADTKANRLPPGDGEFDLAGLAAGLPGIGTGAVPVSVEVFPPEGDRRDPTAVAGALAAATRRILADHPG